MKVSFQLKKHATLNMYIYTSYFKDRRPLTEPDRFSMTGMYIVPFLAFDVGTLRNAHIRKATLTVTALNEMISQAVDVSTITQDWDPAFCTYYEHQKDQPWADGGWASDVIMGAGHSIYCRSETAHDAATGSVRIDIAPELVAEMACGRSHGLSVMDAKSSFYPGPEEMDRHRMHFAVSPALGQPPVLEVEYDPAEEARPAAVCGFTAVPIYRPERSGAAVQLHWRADAPSVSPARMNLLFRETSSAAPFAAVPDRMIPVCKAGPLGTVVTGLAHGAHYEFALDIENGGGRSDRVYAQAATLEKAAKLCLPEVRAPEYEDSENALRGGRFTVGVTDDLAKTDPITGRMICLGGPERPWNNGIWRQGRLALPLAPGERYGFQLVVKTEAGGRFQASIHGDLADVIQISRLWYLKMGDTWYPDAVVPVVDGQFEIPWRENNIPGQKAMALFVDICVPETQRAGAYTLSICLQEEAGRVVVPVEVEVCALRRDRPDYRLELNGYVYPPRCAGYGPDDKRQREVEQEYYRLGHDSYGVVNILPYSHFGIVQSPAYAPKVGWVGGEMRVTDWTEWDAHWEPYLSGSYVEETEGRRVPIPQMYLPFHENWPMKMEDYYTVPVPDLPYPENVSAHVRLSRDPWQDFRPGYREGIKSVMKDFIRHFEEKRWVGTDFHYFFNNKNFYKRKRSPGEDVQIQEPGRWLRQNTTSADGEATSWWLLDEPHFRQDWEMLAYYGAILQEARAETGGGQMIKFRADLSCFNQAFDFLDGLLDINVVGGIYADCREDMLRARKRGFGEQYWPYGGWTGIDGDNIHSALWILDVFLKGSDGVIPWYSYALDANYEQADELAVIYPGRRFGLHTALPSMRLKSGRKAMELVRYLEAFRKAFGVNDGQLRAYVESFVKLQGGHIIRGDADAGVASYAVGQAMLEELRVDLLRRLAFAR